MATFFVNKRLSILARTLFALSISLFFSACTTSPTETVYQFPPLRNSADIVIPETDVLAMTPAMTQFLSKNIQMSSGSRQKLLALQKLLADKTKINFIYNANTTLSAAQAFEQQTGNCLAFANMFVAMARELGLNARFQQMSIPPEWGQRGNAYLVAKHMNVLVQTRNLDYTIDIGQVAYSNNAPSKIIPDTKARAHYLNNLGAQALLEDNLATAYAYFVAAVKQHPDAADIWSNLGVTYNRNDQKAEAEWAYRQSVNLQPSPTALNNLANLYRGQGKIEQADRMAKKLKHHNRSNPYYLYNLSREALDKKEYRQSIKLLRKALRRKSDEHTLHFALAKSLYLAGLYDKANSRFERAKQLAPPVVLDNLYSKPLGEIVASQES